MLKPIKVRTNTLRLRDNAQWHCKDTVQFSFYLDGHTNKKFVIFVMTFTKP